MKLQLLNTLTFLSFLLYCACNKPVNTLQLPAATHTGANVIGFRLNGKIYTTSGAGAGFTIWGTNGVSYIAYGDSNAVIIARSTDQQFDISMSSKYNFLPGTFPITNTPYLQGASIYGFKTDNMHGGYITYTYYDGNILAGTFAFDAVDANDSVVHITDGRFDIKNN